MVTATVSTEVESVTAESEQTGTGVAGLLDAAGNRRTNLPCQVGDPDLWFGETPAELEQAKRLCADCPIRSDCLASALSRGEPWGVWGGEIFEHGAIVARKRPRGRPRKHPKEENDS